MIWTWWGGLVGPAIFCHVKCQQCGTTFNGKTGKSNQTVIVLWLVISAIIGVILGVVGVVLAFLVGTS